MSRGKFISLLLCTIAITAGILFMLSHREDTEPYIDLGISTGIIFTLLSIVVYGINERLTDTNKKSLFIQIILTNMILKMVLSAMIVYIYYINNAPEDGAFILPFLVVYVIYTVFETYFMNEQARAK